MLGLYIHIPFCKHLCHYCDFVKTIPRDQKVIDKYLDKLIEEINSYRQYFSKIETIFIGGGTPNVLNNDNLNRLLLALKDITPTEFTIEINPELYTHEQGTIFLKHGINRVSLGVQTFNEETLKFLNRQHTNQDVFEAVESLKTLGINNISLDLIFAIPNTTIKDIQYDIDQALSLDVKHISYYSLILEENTYFHYLYNRGQYHEVSQDLSREMFEFIISRLTDNGYNHYEISNFTKPNFQSLHNKIYWLFDDYIGVGLGAHGKMEKTRYYNHKSYHKYLDKPLDQTYDLTISDQITEHLIMGLRLKNGINVHEIESKYSFKLYDKFPKIKEMIDLNLLTEKNGYLMLTKNGIFLGNQVFQIFV